LNHQPAEPGTSGEKNKKKLKKKRVRQSALSSIEPKKFPTLERRKCECSLELCKSIPNKIRFPFSSFFFFKLFGLFYLIFLLGNSRSERVLNVCDLD
jgi:hypothetical protein